MLREQLQVVYDNSGIFSAARAWWTWHVFGHCRWVPPLCPVGTQVNALDSWACPGIGTCYGSPLLSFPPRPQPSALRNLSLDCPCSVAVLDGGMPAWKAAGFEVETSPVDEAALHAPAEALRSPPAGARRAWPARAAGPWVQGQPTRQLFA